MVPAGKVQRRSLVREIVEGESESGGVEGETHEPDFNGPADLFETRYFSLNSMFGEELGTNRSVVSGADLCAQSSATSRKLPTLPTICCTSS